jgi:glycosyltransferase involved in cell wall biosynthesis
LDEAVQSVIAQTFTDWECIVVDDGSTEDLSRVEKMDPRVRLIRQPNRGVSAARNNAIMNSAGEFIAFLDADDIFLPTKLDLQVGILDSSPGVGYCHTAFRTIDAAGVDVGPGYQTFAGTRADMLERGGFLCGTAVVPRRALACAGLFDPLLRSGEDYDLALRIVRFFTAAHVPQELYLYRKAGTSASSDGARMLASIRNVHARIALSAKFGCDHRETASVRRAGRRLRHVWGVMEYDAARKAVNGRKPLAAAMGLIKAAAWSPRYTLTSLLKFPLPRLGGGATGRGRLR